MRKPVHVCIAACLSIVPLLCSRAVPPDPDRHHRQHILYVTTRDREPLPGYKERLHRIMVDVQDFYRTEMERNGYGPLTFPLDLDAEGNVRVHVVKLDWDFDPERKWTPREIKPFITEILAKDGIDVQKSYTVAFMNAYWQQGERWTYDVVYTGGGNPQRAATWISDHVMLDAKNFDPVLEEKLNDRGHKMTIGQFNVKMIGGVAHELGHALGLPHNRELPSQKRVLGNALMGAGNYTYRRERIGPRPGAFLTKAHAFILSQHPLFSRKWTDNYTKPEIAFENLKFEHADGGLLISGRVDPSDDVTGIVLYDDELPTGVNKDYDARSYLAGLRANGQFAASIELRKAGQYAIHLKVYFKNGMHRKFSFEHTVKGERKADLAALKKGAAWVQAKTAFGQRSVSGLEAAVEALRKHWPERVPNAERFRSVACRWDTFSIPADIATETREVLLSSTRWSDATVGWYIPSFDGVLDPNGARMTPLKTDAGVAEHGLYAHADARYTYQLDGKWKTFTVKCAIQKAHRGSVVFSVHGDGKELHRTKVIKLADGLVAIEVPVAGVNELSLVTDPGGDGKDRDWGIWIDPMLKR